jgi:hypothetical protein
MTSSPPGETSFARKLREKREREAAERAEQLEAQRHFDEDLIPEAVYERSETDSELDAVLDRITILDAYRRWCGKMQPSIRPGQRESIKVSCPFPGHRDLRPSAWLNLDKNTGVCGPCGFRGFDKYDLAAIHHGLDPQGYKVGSEFRKLRTLMAEDFGYTVTTELGHTSVYKDESAGTTPEPDATDQPDNTALSVQNGHTEQPGDPTLEDLSDPAVDDPAEIVEELFEQSQNEAIEQMMPTLEWRKVLAQTPDTFLDAVMHATSIDDTPEEYNFWATGLGSLGLTTGRDVTLRDSIPVYGNLFICTLGRSGSGKSRAKAHYMNLIRGVHKYDPTPDIPTGVKIMGQVSSAEYLIQAFSKPVMDPNNDKQIAYYAPVKGLLDYPELASLTGRAGRSGSVLKPGLIDVYDVTDSVTSGAVTTGTKVAEKPYGALITTTQPRVLRELLADTDDSSGFLNRFVFVCGKPKKRIVIGGRKIDLAEAKLKLEQIKGWVASFRPGEQIEWSDDAANIFTEFYYQRIEPTQIQSDNELLVRLDLLMKKLVLLFTVNLMEKTVSVLAVEQAIMCFDYLVDCYAIVASQMIATNEKEIVEAIEYQLRRLDNGKGVTLRDISKALKRRNYPLKQLTETLRIMVEIGWVTQYKDQGASGGRPTVRYKNAME